MYSDIPISLLYFLVEFECTLTTNWMVHDQVAVWIYELKRLKTSGVLFYFTKHIILEDGNLSATGRYVISLPV